jgi:GT2 family glycosyltransferase/glycosyltransferase involved in cell wall biosynthesis
MIRRSFLTTPPKILFQNNGEFGSGIYRMLLPASMLRRHGYVTAQAHGNPIVPDALSVLDPDAVIFQMFQTAPQLARIKEYRKTLKHTFFVYEIDDLFWEVPESSWHAKTNPLLPNSKANIRTAACHCNAITVSTPELAEEMVKLTGIKDVRVALNHITQTIINGALAGRRSSNAMRSDRPRVGWAGGVGHEGDLRILTDVVKQTRDHIQWVFMGMAPPGVEPESLEIHVGVPFNDYPEFLGRLNLDIALAPLEDLAFNQCKSDLRVLEYAAAGFPVIASNIGTYRHCPVRTVKNDSDAWLQAIDDLLNDPDRAAYGESLHEWVCSKRLLEQHLPDRAQAYLPKNTEIFIPNVRDRCAGQVMLVSQDQHALDLPHYPDVETAWKAAPGADILFVREATALDESQVARIIHALDRNASATPLCNDCGYPQLRSFQKLPPTLAVNIDTAAITSENTSISCPYPSGPVTLLSGLMLSQLGLPDTSRFGSVEYAFAEWGARAMESGKTNITVANTYVHTDAPLQQPEDRARRVLEHICMWSPAFASAVHGYQDGPALAAVIENLEVTYNSLFHTSPSVENYDDWQKVFYTLSTADREAMEQATKSWADKPRINIILPVYNPPVPHLQECIDSVLAQVYPHWHLCICDDASTDPGIILTLNEYLRKHSDRISLIMREKNGHICAASNDALKLARDGWCVFLDHDDTLTPQALWFIAQEINQHPDTEFIYTDSDKIGQDGKYLAPYFTPDFSYELLLAQNYVTHLCAYRTATVKEIGGLREGLEGSQDWDLVLRYLEHTCGNPPDERLIRHIHQIGYHWRQSENSTSGNIMAKPYAFTAARRAVSEHLHRTEQTAFLAPNPALPIFLMSRFQVPQPEPTVSIIIPTSDNPEQLDTCVKSVLSKTVYPNYEIAIIDGGVKPVMIRHEKVRVIRHHQIPFNFAAVNNFAAERSAAEYLCFLNDDTEVIEQAWLMDMIGMARRPRVGAVGAKLLYPNNTIQHCGVQFNPHADPGQCALHMWQQMGVYDPGQVGRAVISQPVLAVTAACMVIRRSLFQEIGGFDTKDFPVDYNDVDLCIRLHCAGYRNVVCAQAVLKHDAGSTKRKGRWDRARMLAAEQVLAERYHDVVDPYVNPNLSWSPHHQRIVGHPNSKPWRTALTIRRLLVNASETDLQNCWIDGVLPFSARLEGHFLIFDKPAMPNVRPIDIRGTTDGLIELLTKLGITDIEFCGIGDGTLAATGYFSTLRETGWQVLCQEGAERRGNEHGYYHPLGWRAAWERLTKPQSDFATTAAA